MNGVLARLGAMPVERFVRSYWQRHPLIVRNALERFRSPVSVARLFELARDPAVESRLVRSSRGRWSLAQGPFSTSALPSRRQSNWTLLVQGVDLHDAAVAALAARFRFLPAARFDDVMVSYATDGGGVGPHVDQYDVFLLQAQGKRRWRIARHFDEHLVEGLPLRILRHFEPEHEWVLEPGDLLYLPPGVAHEGVAIGECVTISVGFRLPPCEELAEAWHELRAREQPLSGRLGDDTRRPTSRPGQLPAQMVTEALRQLRHLVPTRVLVRRALLENLTEPKANVVFDAPRPALALGAFIRRACSRGLALDLRTRMLYAGKLVAINGESIDADGAHAALLRRVADERALPASVLKARPKSKGTDEFLRLVHNWYRFGWVRLAA